MFFQVYMYEDKERGPEDNYELTKSVFCDKKTLLNLIDAMCDNCKVVVYAVSERYIIEEDGQDALEAVKSSGIFEFEP